MNKRLIISEIHSLDELSLKSTPQEWSQAAKFTSERRRREWLSWRSALRESLGREPFMGADNNVKIAYRESGAPYIVDIPILYISVSHTRTHIAVMLCDTPCAIDIELLDRNFSNVLSRYLSPTELNILGSSRVALGWCAKEAAYKYIGDKPLDLLRDIVITNIDTSNQTISISILNHNHIAHFTTTNSYCFVEIW